MGGQLVATNLPTRVRAIDDLLRRWGYTPAHIEYECPLNVSYRHSIRVDIAAFSDTLRHDTSTSTIIAQTSISSRSQLREVQAAAALIGAPITLLGDGDSLSVWAVAPEPERAVKLDEASFDDLTPLYDRTNEMGPATLARLKEEGAQFPLFPVEVDLLDFARKTSRDYLTQTVEQLVAETSSLIGQKDSTLVTKMAIGAIAVVMLRDKGLVDRSLVGGGLLDAATSRFAGYLNWVNELSPRHLSAFDAIVVDLERSLSFAGLEPYMVSDVYEEALVTQTQRRDQGTFYTPPALARQMLRAVPLEEFPVEERHILDPACGSGTMLVSAADRLRDARAQSSIHDAELLEAHEYVTGHLRGLDKDYFATEISKLALLLAALPIGNSWHVEAKDLFTLKPTEVNGPSVIISNPPWQNSRTEGRRIEAANRFLAWMIEALRPNGYLACVLPQSWIEAKSNRDSRRNFFNHVELLDLWRLPTEVFPQTSDAIAPIVLVAHKRTRRRGRPTLVKAVTSERSLRTFYETGRAVTSFLATPGADGRGLLTGRVTQYLNDKAGLRFRISDVATVRNGRPHRPGRPQRGPEDATHWEVSSLNDLPAFGQAVARLPVVFPDDFDNTGTSWQRYIAVDKLLVTAKRWSTRDPWRFKVGFDRNGYIPRELFHVVVPIHDADAWQGLPQHRQLPALLALLGSGLANCWVDELSLGRNMSPRSFDSLPVPNSTRGWETLSVLGEALVEASGDPKRLAEACLRLEDTIAEVYRLPMSARKAIAARLGGHLAPEGGTRYPSLDDASDANNSNAIVGLPSFGEVLDVDLERGLRLWVSGITDDEGIWVGVPAAAHGWLAAAGMDFVVEGDLTNLPLGAFSLHQSEWRIPSNRLADEL